MNEALQEITAMTMRWFRRLSREPITLVFGLIQPMLFWLILFGNQFKNVARLPGFQGTDYINFLTGGVIVMTVLNSGLAGGVDLLFDKENGFLERLMAAPIHRSSLILSRFLFVMVITGFQILVLLVIAYLFFGVYPVSGLGGIALILFIGLLFGLGLISLSLALALRIKGHGAFFSLIGFFSTPLIFLSGALVPIQAMPLWMQLLARLNPMTYAIDAIRGLILHGFLWRTFLAVTGVLILFDALCLVGGNLVFKRSLG
ncbi:MAG TPA: ABC transporter permease [Nitrospiria bacterium]|jgi:ABC-2 type transport system permease protein|nr:ABC transporter permease [Nitrospiria bacterium]